MSKYTLRLLGLFLISCMMCGCKKEENSDLVSVESVNNNLVTGISSIKENVYSNLDLTNVYVNFPDIDQYYNLILTTGGTKNFDEIMNEAKNMVETYFEGHNYSEDNWYYWGEVEGVKNEEGWPKLIENKDRILSTKLNQPIFYEYYCENKQDDDNVYLMVDPYSFGGMCGHGYGRKITDGQVNNIGGWFADYYYEEQKLYRLDDDLSDSFRLNDDHESLQDAVSFCDEFLNKDYLPNKYNERIDTQVSAVKVMKYNDIYGFLIFVENKYGGISFDYDYALGNITEMSDGKQYLKQINNIFMANKNQIDYWYIQQPYSSITECGDAVKKIVSLEKAVDIVSKNMTQSIKFVVNSIEFVYCPLEFEEGKTETKANASWKIIAENPNDGKQYIMFVDATSGDMRYYTRVITEK